MDYRDVTQHTFVSNRVGNPLMPTYLVKNDDNKFEQIGEVRGSKPNVLPPARTDPAF